MSDCHQCDNDAILIEAARDEERAAIVAWLRSWMGDGAELLKELSADIERGAHGSTRPIELDRESYEAIVELTRNPPEANELVRKLMRPVESDLCRGRCEHDLVCVLKTGHEGTCSPMMVIEPVEK